MLLLLWSTSSLLLLFLLFLAIACACAWTYLPCMAVPCTSARPYFLYNNQVLYCTYCVVLQHTCKGNVGERCRL